MDNSLLTVSVPEAGKLLSIGRGTSYRLAKEGIIPTLRLGKKLRVPMVAIENLLKNTGNNKED